MKINPSMDTKWIKKRPIHDSEEKYLCPSCLHELTKGDLICKSCKQRLDNQGYY